MAKNKKEEIYPLQHWFRSRQGDLAKIQLVINKLFLIKIENRINRLNKPI